MRVALRFAAAVVLMTAAAAITASNATAYEIVNESIGPNGQVQYTVKWQGTGGPRIDSHVSYSRLQQIREVENRASQCLTGGCSTAGAPASAQQQSRTSATLEKVRLRGRSASRAYRRSVIRSALGSPRALKGLGVLTLGPTAFEAGWRLGGSPDNCGEPCDLINGFFGIQDVPAQSTAPNCNAPGSTTLVPVGPGDVIANLNGEGKNFAPQTAQIKASTAGWYVQSAGGCGMLLAHDVTVFATGGAAALDPPLGNVQSPVAVAGATLIDSGKTWCITRTDGLAETCNRVSVAFVPLELGYTVGLPDGVTYMGTPTGIGAAGDPNATDPREGDNTGPFGDDVIETSFAGDPSGEGSAEPDPDGGGSPDPDPTPTPTPQPTATPTPEPTPDPNRPAPAADARCGPTIPAVNFEPLKVGTSSKFPFGIFAWIATSLGGWAGGGALPVLTIPMPGEIDDLVVDMGPVMDPLMEWIRPVFLVVSALMLMWLLASSALGFGAARGSD